ncbi:hypothetical protein JDS37_04280 [Vreelandella venusta]|uniref:Uncharacterized protein n=2 Tax=Vreelandella venusta TaxID=44935 RepID=A0AAQ0CI36_9GAMM|nr:hypothetical protein IR195_04575 [Halomonas venusta]QRL04180.1 hypothetical protein JDS37_04280 [Halomonas venusta]
MLPGLLTQETDPMAALTITRKLLHAVKRYRTQRRFYEEPRFHDPHLLKDIGLRWEQGQLVSIHGVNELHNLTQRHQADTRAAYETCPHCGSSLT